MRGTGRGGGLLFEFTRDDVAEDLVFAAGVHAEPCEGLDAIFVDDAQRAIMLMGVVFVPGLEMNNWCRRVNCKSVRII